MKIVAETVINHGPLLSVWIEFAFLAIAVDVAADCHWDASVHTHNPAGSRPWCSLVPPLGATVAQMWEHLFLALE